MPKIPKATSSESLSQTQMPLETIRAKWTHGQKLILRDRFDFPIVITQPLGVNGAGGELTDRAPPVALNEFNAWECKTC